MTREGGEVVLDVRVDVARDEDERREGLRGRVLAADEGLWIDFPAESEVCLVNDGVAFDVDALFVRDGRVAALRTLAAGDATPVCGEASDVLEVRGGEAREVSIGDLATLHE